MLRVRLNLGGGGLCLPGAELPLIPRADRCAAARAELMHLTSFSIHSRNSVFVHPHFESRHWPSIIIIIYQIIQQYPPNPWKKIEQCTSTSIQFRRAGQQGPTRTLTAALKSLIQEAQLSPKDRAMRRVSWNLANCHATAEKLLVRQVLNKSKLWSWRVKVGRCVINMCTQPWRIRVAFVVL